MFSKNVGRLDRTVRLGVGAVLVYLAVTRWEDSLLGKLGLVAGMDLLVTGYSQWCPTYSVLGIDTGSKREAEPIPGLPA